VEKIMISKAEIVHFQKQLFALMNRLGREQSQLRDEAVQGSGGEASGGLSDVPIHLGDLGSHEAEEDVTLGLLENEEALMKEINEALARIDQNTFGVCERCRKEISKERLHAIPYARHCAPCARDIQRR
jgi:RNA polymerase-binding transcription factor DksA